MKEPNEQPIRQTLKIVELLECVPGHSKTPNGPPITILTLGHLGEVEQPLLLTLDDTQKLLVSLLASLAYHGDEFAKGLLNRYFSDDEYGDDDDDDRQSWATLPDQPTASARASVRRPASDTCQPLKPTGKLLTVQFADGRPTIRLSVLQAYQSERGTMFIYRKRTNNACIEAVALVVDNTVQLCAAGDDVLDEKYWADFTCVMPNIEFTFGKCRGLKLSIENIATLTKRKYLHIT